jgi:hypothetical protein
MKTLYENLQAFLKEPPRFQPSLLVMKCPEFLVNALQSKHGDAASSQKPVSSIQYQVSSSRSYRGSNQ